MHQIVSWLLLELPLFLVTAVATHLVISFSQTILHYRLGHRRLGGTLYRNHLNFHHTYYSRDHLVSTSYRGDEGNNTPYFLLPVIVVGGCVYFLLPLDLFAVVVVTSVVSFYVHVLFDKEYHVEGSWFLRFGWFRRKLELHFVHHRHANSNFAVIDFFWDRLLGTYRGLKSDMSRVAHGPPVEELPAGPDAASMSPSYDDLGNANQNIRVTSSSTGPAASESWPLG